MLKYEIAARAVARQQAVADDVNEKNEKAMLRWIDTHFQIIHQSVLDLMKQFETKQKATEHKHVSLNPGSKYEPQTTKTLYSDIKNTTSLKCNVI